MNERLFEKLYANAQLNEMRRPEDVEPPIEEPTLAKDESLDDDDPNLLEDDQLLGSLQETVLIGDCRQNSVIRQIWGSTTTFAQDLGYWARMDEFDGGPKDSNYDEISIDDFPDVDIPNNGHELVFLKRYDGSLYVIYDIDDDVHFFFA